MNELVLGTAQLGLNYGINNNFGKPNITEAFDILDYALENKIKILDTAGAYGDSESIIGMYLKMHKDAFKIITKLPKIKCEREIKINIEKSLKNLGIPSIDYYLIHSFNDIIEHKEAINILGHYKKTGILKNIGVSIYEPIELEYIIENLGEHISMIQIPFNILDSRWLNSGLIEKANEKGIAISCRSIYLQGLFFADDIKINNIHPEALKYISYIRNIAFKKEINLKRLLMDFVKVEKNIQYVLIGCETTQQLKENIKEFNYSSTIDLNDIKKINAFVNNIPSMIIDPREWNK